MPWKECNQMDERLKFIACLIFLALPREETKSTRFTS
jgi:hypothetical protein